MVKKELLKLFISLSVVSVIIGGCASKTVAPSDQKRTVYEHPATKGSPEWVLKPQVKGKIAGIGSAPMNAGNDINFQREEAMSNARDYIARQIETKVANMIKNFKSATGSGPDATFDKAVESISKQIASQTLSGTVLEDTWLNEESVMYVLVVLDTESVKNAIGKSIKTSFKNDEALYQKFLAAKAKEELDRELEDFNK